MKAPLATIYLWPQPPGAGPVHARVHARELVKELAGARAGQDRERKMPAGPLAGAGLAGQGDSVPWGCGECALYSTHNVRIMCLDSASIDCHNLRMMCIE